jgi:hypothetical protein
MSLREVAVRFVPRHTRLGRIAWTAGRRFFGPKVLVPGTLGDLFLLVPPERLSMEALHDAGFPTTARIERSWPVKPGDVHRSHGYHLCIIEIGEDPSLYLNAYRAAFVESCFIILDSRDLSPLIWRLRGLGDPLGYRAAHLARDVQGSLGTELSDEERFGLASVAHLARRAKFLVVPDADQQDQLRALGSLTPTAVIPPGPAAEARLAAAIQDVVTLVKDPAHAALELWASALADMGMDPAGTDGTTVLTYLQAMDGFKGTPSNLQGQA